MQLIADDVDGNCYVDIVLSPAEMKRISQLEIISGELVMKRKKYYIGIRLQGLWDYNDQDDEDQGESDF